MVYCLASGGARWIAPHPRGSLPVVVLFLALWSAAPSGRHCCFDPASLLEATPAHGAEMPIGGQQAGSAQAGEGASKPHPASPVGEGIGPPEQPSHRLLLIVRDENGVAVTSARLILTP